MLQNMRNMYTILCNSVIWSNVRVAEAKIVQNPIPVMESFGYNSGSI